jgi:1-acyl-sn-glycerol-3-phosphate acyltransferase
MNKYDAEVKQAIIEVRRFIDKVFTKVVVTGPTIDPAIQKDNGIFLVSSHRSHTDYFLVGMLYREFGIQNIRFAAGDNLTNMPILGPKFQGYGAFTVTRDNSLQRSYVRNLCEEVVKMLGKGDSILVFPEGGRSYQGNMMEMKGGITTAGILAQARDHARKIFFIPTAVSYEQLPELRYFDLISKGKRLRKPGNNILNKIVGTVLYYGADLMAFAKFLSAPKFGIKYGKVFVDHTAPIPLSDWLNPEDYYDAKARDEFSAYRSATQKLSEKLFETLVSLYRILPVHIVSLIIKDRGATTIEQTAEMCPEIVADVKKLGRNCLSLNPLSKQEIAEQGLAGLKQLKAISITGSTVTVRRPWLLRYYAAALA